MFKLLRPLSAALGAALLCSCAGSSSPTATVAASTAHGTLAVNPPFRIGSLNAATFQAQLAASSSGTQLLQITGTPSCGVDFYYIKFWTLGGAGETTESSGALMVPTGAAPACSGPRPIVLYAHGTNPLKTLNIADITNTTNTEGALIAAVFAAQGYIVVAPNYAGYDISTLGYHPFLNAQQQSGEMIDILTAARTALPNTMSSATSDGGKLFITGYSEGGHVAMATQRALEATGAVVTGAAPMSGPYALVTFGDAIFLGAVNLGSTEFSPLITTSYQKAYGNIYTTPGDVYSSTYVPRTANYPVPPSAQAPLFSAGFGTPYLINNSFRVAYAADALTNQDGGVSFFARAGAPLPATEPVQTLRQALYKNDLRNGDWRPSSPSLLCGGGADPTVFFPVNTGTMAVFWSSLVQGHLTTGVDFRETPSGNF